MLAAAMPLFAAALLAAADMPAPERRLRAKMLLLRDIERS